MLTALAAAGSMPASAQGHIAGRFEARYDVTLAGVTIGTGTWIAQIGETQYTTAASGQVAGILRAFGSAEGSAAATGTIRDGRPVPASYAGHVISDDGDDEVRMSLESGAVTGLAATPTLAADADRVPVTDSDRRGVMDPISAGLIPVPGNADVMSTQACDRTLPVFDGRQRFDVRLAFKRMDKVKPDKGYQGPAVVCAVRYEPRAGYRRNRVAVKFLIEARDIEMWLVPIAGTRLLVPARISVPTLIGTAVLDANRFETAAQPTPVADTAAKDR